MASSFHWPFQGLYFSALQTSYDILLGARWDYFIKTLKWPKKTIWRKQACYPCPDLTASYSMTQTGNRRSGKFDVIGLVWNSAGRWGRGAVLIIHHTSRELLTCHWLRDPLCIGDEREPFLFTPCVLEVRCIASPAVRSLRPQTYPFS